MTPTPPVGAGSPDRLDLDAAERLEANEAGRLDLVRVRAEKWIGGIGALTGVVSTVLVVKGRDTVAEIGFGWRLLAALCVGGALLCLAYGTYRAYQAAFGEPAALAEISDDPLAGLHRRLLAARRVAATEALVHLGRAIKATFIGLGLIGVGVGIMWFAPEPEGDATKSVCVFADGNLVAELDGGSAAVRRTEAGTTIGACP